MSDKLIPKYCPHCKSENIIESDEMFCDSYEVGDTYRCLDCRKGFGFLVGENENWRAIKNE